MAMMLEIAALTGQVTSTEYVRTPYINGEHVGRLRILLTRVCAVDVLQLMQTNTSSKGRIVKDEASEGFGESMSM
jgi:hypothetical protein